MEVIFVEIEKIEFVIGCYVNLVLQLVVLTPVVWVVDVAFVFAHLKLI